MLLLLRARATQRISPNRRPVRRRRRSLRFGSRPVKQDKGPDARATRPNVAVYLASAPFAARRRRRRPLSFIERQTRLPPAREATRASTMRKGIFESCDAISHCFGLDPGSKSATRQVVQAVLRNYAFICTECQCQSVAAW
jgi:hypothetical protein